MKDQVVLITGASRGIGQQTAAVLAEHGARIVAGARSSEGLERTRAAVEQVGGECHTVVADVSRIADVDRLLQSAVSTFGRIDVLINNAGMAPMAPMEEYDVPAFDAMIAVNCSAVFYTTRRVWPVFIRQGGGRIVNISSVAAVDPFTGFAAYGASKAWVNAFTKALAQEGRQFNIQVYGIAPGAVDTDMLRDNFPDFPANQCLPPVEIARAIAWILDPRSRHASGATVYVSRS